MNTKRDEEIIRLTPKALRYLELASQDTSMRRLVSRVVGAIRSSPSAEKLCRVFRDNSRLRNSTNQSTITENETELAYNLYLLPDYDVSHLLCVYELVGYLMRDNIVGLLEGPNPYLEVRE